MMRQLFRDKASRERTQRGWMGAILLFFLLALFLIPLVRTIVTPLLFGVARPLWAIGHNLRVGTQATLSAPFSFVRLAEENRVLKERISTLENDVWKNTAITEERDTLKTILGRSTSTEKQILGYVLASPNRAPYDTLVLDGGAEVGMIKGAQVKTDGGFVIGVIREVFAHQAIAELYSSPGQVHDITVGSSHIPAVAHGVGGGNFRIELPQQTDIGVGDAVTFPGEGEHFLGVVEHVLIDEKTGITTLLLRLPINMMELHSVIVSPALLP